MVVSSPLDSSTVMTPSLPTLSMASAMILPMDSSLLAEMAPTWAIISPLTSPAELLESPRSTASTALSMPFLIRMGLAPAATYFRPSPIDGLGQDGRGRRAVAGHVVGLRGDLLDQLGAHVLPGVLELDFLGDGHAVLGAVGRAEFLLQNDILPPRSERRLDQVAENVDALEQGLSCVFTGGDLLGHVSLLSSSATRPSPGSLLRARSRARRRRW